jgi:hypothetical protein
LIRSGGEGHHVKPQTKNEPAGRALLLELKQNAPNLALGMNNIVGPLKREARRSEALKGFYRRHAHGQGSARQYRIRR